jgi:hypothetical protein
LIAAKHNMTELLSIPPSVVGINASTLEDVRLFIEVLQQLKEAPQTVKSLLEDLQSVETSLNLLQGVKWREWDLLGASVQEKLETTIGSCMHACHSFRYCLQPWNPFSEGGKLASQDRISEGQVKAMSDQLQNCKLSISLVISVANL